MRWNPRLFTLFFAPSLLAISAAALTVGLYADRALEALQLRTLADQTLRAAQLVGNVLPWDSQGASFDSRCRAVARATDARITVIALDGTVLCDSEGNSAEMENHLQRSEVRDALRDGSGHSVGASAILGRPFFYSAYLQHDTAGARIVCLAVPVATVTVAQQRIRLTLVLSLLVAAALGLWPAVRLSRRLSDRIHTLVRFSQAVAAEAPPPALAPEASDEFGTLETNLASMGRAVGERLRVTRGEEQKLRAVLAAMVEGVLVVSKHGELVLLNDRAREIFGIPATTDYVGRPLVEICRDPELQQLVRDTIRMPPDAGRLAREIAIAGESPRVLMVNAAPVLGDHGPLGYVLVFHEITDLKKLEAVRRDFVANVSHELRTPLTAIRGYAETLLTGALDDRANARKFLGVIVRNAERLTRLIDDLLVLSDLELGRTGLQRASVSVRAAIEAAIQLVAEKAHRGGVILRNAVLPDVPPIDADGDRVEQVLVNLIDNAVKYTPDGGTVTVTARSYPNDDTDSSRARGADYVEIAVADTGLGIPSQELPRLTERFYRVDKARSRELGGTGLGLAIVKHILQAHGGWMRIESELGKGTTVRVVFPTASK